MRSFAPDRMAGVIHSRCVFIFVIVSAGVCTTMSMSVKGVGRQPSAGSRTSFSVPGEKAIVIVGKQRLFKKLSRFRFVHRHRRHAATRVKPVCGDEMTGSWHCIRRPARPGAASTRGVLPRHPVH
jgi:hypothetical protein